MGAKKRPGPNDAAEIPFIGNVIRHKEQSGAPDLQGAIHHPAQVNVGEGFAEGNDALMGRMGKESMDGCGPLHTHRYPRFPGESHDLTAPGSILPFRQPYLFNGVRTVKQALPNCMVPADEMMVFFLVGPR
jgi:hypothetical protein